MKFNSNEERKQHPLAGMIPDYIWNMHFNCYAYNEAGRISEAHLHIMSLSEEELCTQEIEIGLDAPAKFKTFLVILVSHPNLSKNTLRIMIGKVGVDCCQAFSLAARCGLMEILQYLEDLFPNRLQDMIKANAYDAFRLAAKHGHLNVLEYLAEKAPSALPKMIQIYNYEAFREAAQKGHINVLEYLETKIQPPVALQDMIKAHDCYVFRWAASNGYIKVLEYLETKIQPKEELQDMIKANAYDAFRLAAKNGHIEVLEYLETKIQPKEALQDMIKANDYYAFRWAARHGHIKILEYLATKIQPPAALQDMIKAKNYEAFGEAARHGHIKVLEYLATKIQPKEALQDMIKANYYYAFHWAASNEQATTLNFLMRYNTVRTEAFRLIARSGLSYDIFKASPFDLKELLKHPAIFAHACSHHTDKIKPFIAEQIKELKERQSHSNPPRLLHNKQEAECLFYLLHYLISNMGVEAKDDIIFLLRRIPELQALLPTARLPHNTTNLALRAALSKRRAALAAAAESWNEIIHAFYRIPEVSAQARLDNHYPTETQGQLDLRAIANNNESSMRAATQEELAQLKKLKEYYQPKILELKNTGGTEWVLGAATGLISEYYSNNKTIFKNTNGEEVKLPLLWDDFQKLNITREDRELALKAYYTSQIHSAYRLFLKPNPWIASDAGHTEVLEGGRAAHFAGYEETMATLILAAFDKEVDKTYSTCNKAEDSSAKNIDSQQLDFQRGARRTSESRLGLGPTNNPDERISLLCLALSDITRAHNWDKSRPTKDAKGNVVFEQYDDLEADKPSCINGVSTRLMQSLAGHPLFIPINVIAEESVREYLQNMIDSKLSYFPPTILQELYTYGQNIAQANAVDERTAQQFQLIFTQNNYNALMSQVLNKYQKLLQEKHEDIDTLKRAIDERLLELGLINQQEKSTNKNLWIDVSDYFNYTQEQIKRIAGERKIVLTSIDVKPDEPTSKLGVLHIIKLYLERDKEAGRVSKELMNPFIQAKNEEELKAAWQEWTPKTNNEKLLAEDLKRNYPDLFAPKQTKCSFADLPDWYQELAQEEAQNQQSSRHRLFGPPSASPRGEEGLEARLFGSLPPNL